MVQIRDFDKEREERRAGLDRSFKIGGEIMEFRYSVHPDALFDAATVSAEDAPRRILDVADALMEAMLTTESTPLWKKVRADHDDPISLAEILDLMNWVVEEQTGRPTAAPSPSPNGEGANGTASTVSSSAPLAAA